MQEDEAELWKNNQEQLKKMNATHVHQYFGTITLPLEKKYRLATITVSTAGRGPGVPSLSGIILVPLLLWRGVRRPHLCSTSPSPPPAYPPTSPAQALPEDSAEYKKGMAERNKYYTIVEATRKEDDTRMEFGVVLGDVLLECVTATKKLARQTGGGNMVGVTHACRFIGHGRDRAVRQCLGPRTYHSLSPHSHKRTRTHKHTNRDRTPPGMRLPPSPPPTRPPAPPSWTTGAPPRPRQTRTSSPTTSSAPTSSRAGSATSRKSHSLLPMQHPFVLPCPLHHSHRPRHHPISIPPHNPRMLTENHIPTELWPVIMAVRLRSSSQHP
jgi:hypothetical protein